MCPLALAYALSIRASRSAADPACTASSTSCFGRVAVRPQTRGERRRSECRSLVRERTPFGCPASDPPVEHRNCVVVVGTQCPPHPCGDRHVVVVVGDDERVVSDARGAHRSGEALGRGEHRRGAIGICELRVPPQVHGAGYVALPVLVVAAAVVEGSQVPPAVDDAHVRVVEVLGEPFGRHQRATTQSFGGSHRATC